MDLLEGSRRSGSFGPGQILAVRVKLLVLRRKKEYFRYLWATAPPMVLIIRRRPESKHFSQFVDGADVRLNCVHD